MYLSQLWKTKSQKKYVNSDLLLLHKQAHEISELLFLLDLCT